MYCLCYKVRVVATEVIRPINLKYLPSGRLRKKFANLSRANPALQVECGFFFFNLPFLSHHVIFFSTILKVEGVYFNNCFVFFFVYSNDQFFPHYELYVPVFCMPSNF